MSEATYVCLNCWQTLPRGRTFFRCNACEPADLPPWMRAETGTVRRLDEVERPWWRRIFTEGDGGGCPKGHSGDLLRLFCDCGYPFSERAAIGQAAPLGLGIAGARGSGKTLLLFTMIHELRRLELAGQKIGLLGLDDSERRFHELSARFFDLGAKPEASWEADAQPQPWDRRIGVSAGNFAWTLTLARDKRHTGGSALLAVYDLGGETWRLPHDEPREVFDRYLGLLGSLVYLIDGGSLAADLGHRVEDAWDARAADVERRTMALQWFSGVLARLGGRAKRVDLALVVSKADGLWGHPDWEELNPGIEGVPDNRRQELLEELLLQSRRRDILLQARKSFRRVRLFAASSLGFQPSAKDVGPEERLTRPITPAGVTEPLIWLLGQRLRRLR